MGRELQRGGNESEAAAELGRGKTTTAHLCRRLAPFPVSGLVHDMKEATV